MPTDRHRWMDVLRGVAIILVVHHHVVDSIYAKYPDASPLFSAISGPMAPLRMPILVFLSGLLVSRSINKGLGPYVRGKLSNIAYPFVVWTLIMYGLFEAREYVLGEPSTINLASALTVSPIHYLWFLYYLFFFYFLAIVFYKARLGFAVIFYFLVLLLLSRFGYQRFACLLAFFIIGTLVGPVINSSVVPWVCRKSVLAFTLAGTIFVLHISEYAVRSYTFNYAAIGVFTIPLLIRASIAIENSSVSPFFEFFGRNSIVVYLVHVPLAMTLPVLFVRVYEGNPNYVYPIFMILVIGVCAICILARNQFVIVARLFSMPLVRHQQMIGARPQA